MALEQINGKIEVKQSLNGKAWQLHTTDDKGVAYMLCEFPLPGIDIPGLDQETNAVFIADLINVELWNEKNRK